LHSFVFSFFPERKKSETRMRNAFAAQQKSLFFAKGDDVSQQLAKPTHTITQPSGMPPESTHTVSPRPKGSV
jgi:hypothetical protein